MLIDQIIITWRGDKELVITITCHGGEEVAQCYDKARAILFLSYEGMFESFYHCIIIPWRWA